VTARGEIRRLDPAEPPALRRATGAELAANYADIARVRGSSSSTSSSSMTAENWTPATTDEEPSVLNGAGSMNERVRAVRCRSIDFIAARPAASRRYIYYLRSVGSASFRRITAQRRAYPTIVLTFVTLSRRRL